MSQAITRFTAPFLYRCLFSVMLGIPIAALLALGVLMVKMREAMGIDAQGESEMTRGSADVSE